MTQLSRMQLLAWRSRKAHFVLREGLTCSQSHCRYAPEVVQATGQNADYLTNAYIKNAQVSKHIPIRISSSPVVLRRTSFTRTGRQAPRSQSFMLPSSSLLCTLPATPFLMVRSSLFLLMPIADETTKLKGFKAYAEVRPYHHNKCAVCLPIYLLQHALNMAKALQLNSDASVWQLAGGNPNQMARLRAAWESITQLFPANRSP